MKEQRLGEISSNKFGTPMKIIDYKNSANVTIEFQDKFKYKITTTYNNFKRKVIKNPYDKTVCGVGYIGEGDYLTKRNHKPTVQYTDWSHIIIRCYKEKERDLHPAYENCKVCDEWLNFQTFAKWYDQNFYDVGHGRMHIDKDILHKGNKVYSPENCIFVPQEINLLFVNRRNYRGEYPIGVSKQGSKFNAICGYNNTVKQLGTYDTPEEAFLAFKTFKEKHIKDVADKYKNKIPKKLYDALYAYQFKITD